MWTRHVAPELPHPRAVRACACLVLLACLAVPRAQSLPTGDDGEGEEVIVQVRANGIERGEFTLLRRADGDFWIAAADLPRLLLAAREPARRTHAGETWYSSTALGATSVRFDEVNLRVVLDFRSDALPGTRIDLSNRPPPLPAGDAGTSLVLSYRLALEQAGGSRPAAALDSALNVRVHGLLLRQEMSLRSAASARRVARGATQVIWEDRAAARRVTAGDVLSTAGPFGSAITGGGLLLQKVYELTPDAVRQPTATLRGSSTLPADVEVSVDGAPVYRAHVAPGPITLDHLLLHGGVRTLRLTVVDAAGRREVFEQPFLFSDSVLARGLHEYSYFAGRRSVLANDFSWHYGEAAWQAFHRYGVTDRVTVAAGGEGGAGWRNLGAGATLREDRLGLFALELLSGADGAVDRHARGWSARYTYVSPRGSLVLGRRRFGAGFRTFAGAAGGVFPSGESRIGGTTRFGRFNLSADLVRAAAGGERRSTRFVRASTFLSRDVSVFAEYQTTRVDGAAGWTAAVYLRIDLDTQHWASASASAAPQRHAMELETGRPLTQGEGLGYRLALTTSLESGRRESTGSLSADWHLRPASLGVLAVAPLEGSASSYVRGEVSGALAGLDGYWGLTREVSDAFALVRLGVPQPGVQVFLNNQSQGRTDAQGRLFIPELSSLGRQEISIDDRELEIQYLLPQKRRTIVPLYRSGTIVDFGIHKLRAVAGYAWRASGGRRTALAMRAWTLTGPRGAVEVRTGAAGDFYLEDAAPGRYSGELADGSRRWRCRMDVPEFDEPVHEVAEGIVCE